MPSSSSSSSSTITSTDPAADDDSKAPTESGDLLYPRLLEIAEHVSARVLLIELAVLRWKQGGGGRYQEGCEMWKDWPASATSGDKGGDGEVMEFEGVVIRVKSE